MSSAAPEILRQASVNIDRYEYESNLCLADEVVTTWAVLYGNVADVILNA